MDEKKKKFILFLGSVFVAVIFLTSYASFGNNRAMTTSATTTVIVRSFPAFGSSTATVTGYGAAAHVGIGANASAASNAMPGLLSILQSNGTINNYIGSNRSYEVYSSKIDAYALQGLLRSAVNQSNAITVTATAYIRLPQNLTLYYSTYPINVYLNGRNYSVNMTNLKAVGSTVNVSVSALVTSNGLVYNNQLSVSLTR